MKVSRMLLILSCLIFGQAFAISDVRSPNILRRKGGAGESGSGSSDGGSHGDDSSSAGKDSSSTSNTGGISHKGNGPQPQSYPDGNAFYYGGAKVPYTAGADSPSGIKATLLPAADLDFHPGFGYWPYGVYIYHLADAYTYQNSSSKQKETKPVDCLCAAYQECGCDQVPANETAYINGAVNDRETHFTNVNGIETLILNGSLPNGTTVASDAVGFAESCGGLSSLVLAMVGTFLLTLVL